MIRRGLALVAFVLLSACLVVPVPIPISAVAPARALASGAGAVDSFGQRLNAFRAANGRDPLVLNAALTAAAQEHARDMVTRNYYGHDTPEGLGPGDRARAAGYGWCLIAENIAWGLNSETAALTAWEDSAGHRRNMLMSRANEYGFARFGDAWVLMLGRRC